MVKNANRFSSITKQNLLADEDSKVKIGQVGDKINQPPRSQLKDRPTERLQVMLTKKEFQMIQKKAGDIPLSRFIRTALSKASVFEK